MIIALRLKVRLCVAVFWVRRFTGGFIFSADLGQMRKAEVVFIVEIE